MITTNFANWFSSGIYIVMFILDEFTVWMNLKMKKMDAIEVRFPLPEDDFFLVLLLMLDL